MSETRLILDPDRLKPSDMRRAKTALADIIGDRDPMELADPTGSDFGEWFAFMVWCFRSREDPAFTWEQALDVEFGAVELPTVAVPAPAANGASPPAAEAPQARRGRSKAAAGQP